MVVVIVVVFVFVFALIFIVVFAVVAVVTFLYYASTSNINHSNSGTNRIRNSAAAFLCYPTHREPSTFVIATHFILKA